MAVLEWRVNDQASTTTTSSIQTNTSTAMSVQYAPLPNPRTDPETDNELDAAFDDPDDDDDLVPDELRPLNPRSEFSRSSVDHTSLTYDFNTPVADWDQPPPGSPPSATPLALPNSIGNSNGIIPTFTHTIPHAPTSWWRRATAFLPSRYVPFGQPRSSGRARVMGGGTGNDGVFSNVSAKPSASGVRVQAGLSRCSLSTFSYSHLFSSQVTVFTSFPKSPLQQHHRLMRLLRRTQHRHTIRHSFSSLLPPFTIPMPFLDRQLKVPSLSTPYLQAPCLLSFGTHSSAPPSSL